MSQSLQMYDVYTAKYEQLVESDNYKVEVSPELDDAGNPVLDENGEQQYIRKFYFRDTEITKAKSDEYLSDVIDKAQTAVYDAYYAEEGGLQVKWLWIKNVWSPDVPWRKPILDYNQFINNLGKFAKDPNKSGLTDAQLTQITSSENYQRITKKLHEDSQNKNNGYLVLPILSVGLSFLSQFISSRQQKKSGQQVEGAGAGSMKVMMIIMPLMMGFFALSYTAVFTVYIITNSIMTLLINLGSSGILALIDMKKEGKKFAIAPRGEKNGKDKSAEKNYTGVIRYGRPDPNDTKIQGDSFLKDRKKNKKDK